MLHIQAFTFNAFQENTYLIINEKKQCWVVDPGMYDASETDQLSSYINDHQLQPQAIINTHAHIDHIFGVQALKDLYNVPFGIHEKELPVLQGSVGAAMMFGFEDFKKVPEPTFFIAETTPLLLGDEPVIVLFTPGHSTGSISFYSEAGKWVLSGDALFANSIGRTDLPGGDYDTLINSIRSQLLSLPGDTKVYSGHGPATTIGQERLHNPFLQ